MRSVDTRPSIEPVQYPGFKPPNWYTKVDLGDGRTRHTEPWLTLWAAEACANIMRIEDIHMSRRDGGIGDGDICPLFPEHGPMFTLKGSSPPAQWCPDSTHAGRPGKAGPPTSRSQWPLYGFEDSVQTYLARLDRAIRQAELPDLSDLEVT